MVEIPDPVVGILLSNTLERELPASAAATLALVLAKGSVTVTSKALSVMPAPDEDIPRLQCREDDAPSTNRL